MSYRLLSYQTGREARAGVLVADMVYDAARITRNPRWSSVLALLEDWSAARRRLAQATKAIASGRSRARGVPIARVRLLAPVLYPGAIFCAGANYTDHVLEMARAQNAPPPPDPHEVGLAPWHFIKTSRGSVVGPGARVALPRYSRMVDWEVELAAVIGRPAKDVTIAQALDCVAGYTIGNDLSARDAMRRPHLPDASPFKVDWLSQKCFDGSCPLGPWITPASEIADPQKLGLKLWVNDELMQDSNTGQMIFSTAEQIAHLSTRVTLQPGDLVLTGTPAGVGMGRGRFLNAGDRVRLWIEAIGELCHTMR
ncbi:MAG TPA: fumarylacetoacetate hydrolase family protein [Methylomirabilota bacterium]|jgi:2-keto-4-pentenoate hydratase/2-oxohepta-3-ene-1,7-dioic acid hydratase in catechol pathway